MKTILFFTAGMYPTVAEKAKIAKLNALAELPYTVKVLDGSQSAAYGNGNVDGDYYAGTVPAAYKDEDEEPLKPLFDPDAPPAAPTLPATQAVVANTQVLELDGGGTVTLTVANNVITHAVYAAGG